MNYTTNVNGERVLAVGAPGSFEREKCERDVVAEYERPNGYNGHTAMAFMCFDCGELKECSMDRESGIVCLHSFLGSHVVFSSRDEAIARLKEYVNLVPFYFVGLRWTK